MQTPLTASEYLLVEDCSIWTEKRPLPVWREALVPGLDFSTVSSSSDIDESFSDHHRFNKGLKNLFKLTTLSFGK